MAGRWPGGGGRSWADLIRLEADAYRFAHDTLRALVYAHTPEPERRRWHAHALSILHRLAPDDPLPLLHHAEQAGATSQAACYAQQAGEQALAAFSYQAARSYFEQALAWLSPGDLAGRYAATLGLAQALNVLAEREAQRQVVDMLRDLADELDDDRRRAEAAWHQAHLEWITGDFVQAQAVAEAGLRLVRSTRDTQQALLLEIMGRAARDLGDYAGATQCFTQARTCYVQLGDEPGVAWMDGMLGIVAQRQGRLQEAIAYHTRAMNAARQAGNLFNELRAASGLATTLWMAGDYSQARAIFQRTLQLSRQVGGHGIAWSAVRRHSASLRGLLQTSCALDADPDLPWTGAGPQVEQLLHAAGIRLQPELDSRVDLAQAHGAVGPDARAPPGRIVSLEVADRGRGLRQALWLGDRGAEEPLGEGHACQKPLRRFSHRLWLREALSLRD